MGDDIWQNAGAARNEGRVAVVERPANPSGQSASQTLTTEEVLTLKREWDQRIQVAQVRQMNPTEAATTQRRLADIQRKIGPRSALPSMEVMNRVVAQRPPTQQRSPEFDQRPVAAQHEPEPVGPQRDTIEVAEALNQKAQQTAQVAQQIPSPKADSVYYGEKFNIEKVGNVGTITDKSGNILFQYEKTTGDRFIVSQDNLQKHQREAFAQAAANIRRTDLNQVMRDPTGHRQVETLGELAPQGSHAIAFADQVMAPDETVERSEKYTFRRSGNGFEVTRNDEEQSLIAASRDDGKIISGDQTPAELKVFQAKYADARNRIEAMDAQASARREQNDYGRE